MISVPFHHSRLHSRDPRVPGGGPIIYVPGILHPLWGDISFFFFPLSFPWVCWSQSVPIKDGLKNGLTQSAFDVGFRSWAQSAPIKGRLMSGSDVWPIWGWSILSFRWAEVVCYPSSFYWGLGVPDHFKVFIFLVLW